MATELEKALLLRKEGDYKRSNETLIKLVDSYPEDPLINFQCAWSFDVMGQEAKAIPYYEEAISLGLEGVDLEGSLLGLGSSYRTLGMYEKSRDVLLKGIKLFPNNNALKIFYSMTLYNLKEYNKAMEILLKMLSKTSDDKMIREYKEAIDFYSDKLDKIF